MAEKDGKRSWMMVNRALGIRGQVFSNPEGALLMQVALVNTNQIKLLPSPRSGWNT